ncbi:bifunctional enoyl-CoA hydratase/phosphate acetyltransferase [candidate division WOR-3 bacterium]|nr:bifunctional enoyl-CoA hydratase/phosphate acetyltransferase [candidate division WOR-3 bacterium]
MKLIQTFEELVDKAKSCPKQTVSVACGDDPDTIEAIARAVNEGFVHAIMVGDKNLTEELAKKVGIDHKIFEYIDEADRKTAGKKAVELVKQKKADIIMKGMISTSDYARAVLDKEKGLMPPKSTLSHVTIAKVPSYPKFLILSDVAILPQPDLSQKALMIEYCVEIAKFLGIDLPKIAILSASEKVEPKIQSSIDAALLTKMAERGQIKNCIVDGPLALDICISNHSLKAKKLSSPVNGEADVIIFPNIEAGNSFYKGLVYLANGVVAAIIVGATAPGVLVSRADSDDTKFYSIALASLAASSRMGDK